jgi:hypothetical protein
MQQQMEQMKVISLESVLKIKYDQAASLTN